MKQLYALLLTTLSLGSLLLAQPAPTIHGDSLLCPSSTGWVSTQVFDTYQWYLRYYGSTTRTAITGATSQSLPIDHFTYSASYLSVHVAQGSDTATSPEFFVDGWAFLPPVVMHTGTFTTGPNGESIICIGDTLYLTLMQPYDTLVQWYESGSPLPGADSTTLVVTTAGYYTVEGAPKVCPDYLQPLGLTITVLDTLCATAVAHLPLADLAISPNPATDWVRLSSHSQDITEVALYSAVGQCLHREAIHGRSAQLDIALLPRGLYWLQVHTLEGVAIQKLILD